MPYVQYTDYAAKAKYETYRDLAIALSDKKLEIDAVKYSPILTINSFGDASGKLEGTYYDTYEAAVDIWWNQANSIRTALQSFATDLGQRILNAETKRNYWQGQITKTRWEADPK